MKKFVNVTAILLGILLLLSACNGSATLVGKWQADNGNVFEFTEDFLVLQNGENTNAMGYIHNEAEKTFQFTMSGKEVPGVYRYEIKKDTLTFFDAQDTPVTFKKYKES